MKYLIFILELIVLLVCLFFTIIMSLLICAAFVTGDLSGLPYELFFLLFYGGIGYLMVFCIIYSIKTWKIV